MRPKNQNFSSHVFLIASAWLVIAALFCSFAVLNRFSLGLNERTAQSDSRFIKPVALLRGESLSKADHRSSTTAVFASSVYSRSPLPEQNVCFGIDRTLGVSTAHRQISLPLLC